MSWLLDNPERPYIDSSKTDVMRTWKRHGFVPPSEQTVDFKDSVDALNNLTIRKPSNDLENVQEVPTHKTVVSIQQKRSR